MSNILKKCGREELVSAVRKKAILAFILFIWHNFEDQIIEVSEVFCSVFIWETSSIIQFFIATKLHLFTVLNQSSKKSFPSRPTNIFLRKEYLAQQSGVLGRAIPKFEGNKSVINNVIGHGYSTAICYRNIPAFHISWGDVIFRQRS